jgi:hypothetical protein
MNRELLEAYNYQLARINQDEQAGLISDQQAAEFRSQLADELEEAQFSEYEQETEVAEFSAGNSLGATLLEVGEQLGYEDPEEYIVDLADELGLTPEEAYGMIVTDEEPDEELAYDVLDVLGLIEDEDEDEYEVDGEYDEEYEEDADEVPGNASYSAYDPRVDELEAQVAEFQAANALKDVLHKLDVRAQQLIESGDMPPVAYEVMFSSFDSEDDRVAMFSQLAEANGNNINEELVKMQGIIELFERMGLGEMGMFNELIQEEALSNFNSEEQLSPEEEALIVGTSAAIRASRG